MKIILLLYVSRSGSTYLAKNISDRYKNIFVVPEFDFIKPLVKCSKDGVLIDSKRVIIEYKKDPRYSNLKKDLTLFGSVKYNGVNIQDYLELLLKHLSESDEYDYILIKKGDYTMYSSQLKDYFDFTYLHIYRDPRAICNSQIGQKRIYKQDEYMGTGNVYNICSDINKYDKFVRRLELAGSGVLRVSYEELITNTSKTLFKISSQYGLEDLDSDRLEKYVINEKEKSSIHANIGKSPINRNVYKWKDELSTLNIKLIENFCFDYMKKYGYEDKSKTNAKFFDLVKCYLLSRRLRLSQIIDKLKNYLYK